mgnify:CR=1 FL=1
MNQLDLNGRVAVITGGAQGIGYATAERFLKSGAAVVLWDIDAARLDQAVARLAALGAASARVVELTDDASVEAAAAAAGRVDILVNNAGTNPFFGPLLGISQEAYDKTFEVNLTGPVLLARLCAQTMVDSAQRSGAPSIDKKISGSIINISSVAGIRASPLQGTYGMTKAALVSLTQTLAVELGGMGIRVNAIAPGIIETKLAAALTTSQEIMDRVLARTPLGRTGQPDEIAGAVLFLASDAASYLTGHTLVVDGGMTITGV